MIRRCRDPSDHSPDGDYVGALPASTPLPAAILPNGAVALFRLGRLE